jgi:DNA-directed RNA polymerase beta subunit
MFDFFDNKTKFQTFFKKKKNVGEEPNELGGYFIVNGLEKLIRMIVVPRRNTVSNIIKKTCSLTMQLMFLFCIHIANYIDSTKFCKVKHIYY